MALLVRRVRDRLAPEPKDRLLCVGTSATLASDGSLAKQCDNVAAMASKLFGTTIRSEQVIQETLTRTTSSSKEDEGFKQHLRARISSGLGSGLSLKFEVSCCKRVGAHATSSASVI